MIQRLVPNARVGIGHGQMEGKKLEELMLAFMNGEFDVLVATIIGLDVPNANTIFINNANNFGFASDARSCGTKKQQEGVLLFYLSAVFSNDDARREFRHWNNLVI
jgi:transcription-repair coupling factor (superfamily II helicase)